MDAAFTAEQDEIRRTLRELLTKRCGPDGVRAAAATPAGYDHELWRTLAGQLGLPGLAIPAEYGGVGAAPPSWCSPARRRGGRCCRPRCSRRRRSPRR